MIFILFAATMMIAMLLATLMGMHQESLRRNTVKAINQSHFRSNFQHAKNSKQI